ncbi:MAG: hypothetical protein IKD78_06760 [Bacteroidales bacterium]|nr:hypothetical protein [Bacteroidales bacterium]
MALTTELLNANAALAGLTDEQKTAIVEMSKNDETAVIGQKTGEIYGGLDADILAASGIAKNGAEKTYDYAKRVIGEIKGQAGNASALQNQLAEMTKEKARLEGIIAKGGADAETKRALEQSKADLANVTKEYTELKSKYDNAAADYEKALFGMKIDGEFAKATAGLKFKADLPVSVTTVLLDQAVAKVKAMNPEYIDDGNGGKVLAFMENGTPRRNPENNLRPFTAAELVAKELSTMGVLETGRVQTGAGSKGGEVGGQGGSGGTVDISGAKSQDEAHEIIAKQLMAQGKVNGSKEFADAMAEAWKANKDVIKALPVR